MKLKITLLFAAGLMVLSSFAQGNKSALCQKWKVDIDAFIADMPPEMTAMFDILPAEQKKMAMDQVAQSVKNLYIQFNADGTMSSNSDQGPKSGNWKFVENGSAIWSKIGKEESVMDVLELTSEKMRVKERVKQEGQPDVVMTFIPFSE